MIINKNSKKKNQYTYNLASAMAISMRGYM